MTMNAETKMYRPKTRPEPWILAGGTVLQDNTMQRSDLYLEDGCVADAPASNARLYDATGLWLLPGIVDVHGDGFERILMPRPGVTFSLPLALAEADRQMITNGITTAFHGLTISWEPGLRSRKAAGDFVNALAMAQDTLACDTRINFRWETFALEAVDEVLKWIDRLPGSILSINDHTTINLCEPAGSRKIGRMAERTGLSPENCLKELARMAERAGEVPDALTRLATAARALGVSMLAHDEPSAEIRTAHRALGISASEFPMTEETAAAARAAGEHVVFGAPNVLRGGSQNNAVDAGPAMASGLGSVLSSDYFYPSLILAPFQLVDQAGMEFADAWPFVSRHPAEVAGLVDRGSLAPGLRGDVIALCPETRRVRAVFVAGRRRLVLD
ncbi:alpha-D-ribose 1-methylphosphonate 5-triphosphate diphosphatase [Yoonia vestfoldensis]|uniref:alpha-D-ribose 1-methylphosphonate 5-triphosphate diphosphatase n=1 Tax=Yoonia vestfoldensis TaxID=245188 RepID=UPI00036C6E2D|nr:alpha-D-ribose 1-methylphosphonate 5-triphosphate diphosphatase [Yoonia vestfoldensis]